MSDIVERLRSWKQVRTTPYPIGYYLDTGLEAADEIERLRAEVAALKKDAERYRWMRIRCARKGYNLSFTYAAGGEPTSWKPLEPEECDAAIDAALAKEKKE